LLWTCEAVFFAGIFHLRMHGAMKRARTRPG
jgi:hypothetical protein